VGLFTGLLTLPIAPVRGVVWVVEQVVEEADRQMFDEQAIRRELMDLELESDEGTIDADERAAREEELLERLAEAQRRRRATEEGPIYG
jgi:hypothetical protein